MTNQVKPPSTWQPKRDVHAIYESVKNVMHPNKVIFSQSYVLTGNMSQSSADAGVGVATGAAWLKHPHVQELISLFRDILADHLLMSKGAWLHDLNVKRLVDPGQYFKVMRDEETNEYRGQFLRPMDELTPELRRCIKKIDLKNGKIEFYDAMKAGEIMADALGHKTPDGGESIPTPFNIQFGAWQVTDQSTEEFIEGQVTDESNSND